MVTDYIEKIKQDQFIETSLRGIPLTFKTTWGLFSPREIDKATELLIRQYHYSGVKPKTILDLGCGYGAIGLTLAKQFPEAKVYMVDKDYVAVEYAQKNAKLNGIENAEIIMSNGFDKLPADLTFDLIISNLPAKVGKELFHLWLYDSELRLNKNGEIWVVTIAGLREFIKRNFKETFWNYEKITVDKGFCVGKAVKG